jgi:serine/threonine-protein kinase
MVEVQAPQLTPDDPFEGTQYRAVARLGAGGMGEVFLIEQVKLGTTFAAKILHKHLCEDNRLLERLRIEAESLGGLRHANIVAVYDFDRTRDKRPFVVMEYLKGRTLDEDLAIRGPMPVTEALEMVSQLLSALGAAHDLGIVHRDIKPSNLFLCDAAGSSPMSLKVLDFGVVRVLPNASPDAPAPMAMPTATGIVVGTPRYLSPEGALGERVDIRADLYAAALVLFIMLTGRGPFDEMNRDTAMLTAHAYMEPPAPSTLSSQRIEPELDAIVLKGLRKGLDDRYQTAIEFKQTVDRYLAKLRCPTGLRDTALVANPVPPRVSTGLPAPARNNMRLAVWASVVLFLFAGVLTAVAMVFLEGSK